MTEVPTISLDHLTPEQARAYAIADNRLCELSQWNERQLALHMQTLAAIDLDFNIEAMGFTMAEIDLRIEGLDLNIPGQGKDDPDEQPIAAGPAVCKPGELWRLGDHVILCASSLELSSFERLLGSTAVQATFTDPPYNVPINGHVSGKGKRKHREFAAAVGEMSGPSSPPS